MRFVSFNALSYVLAILAMTVAAQPANAAYTLKFSGITNNTPGNPAAGVAQLRVDVDDASTVTQQKVSFKFYHVGTTPMSITGVYFDDGTLLGNLAFEQSSGVKFNEGNFYDNLPSGENIDFKASKKLIENNFSAGSQGSPDGVNPGEWLKITFDLQTGKTFADTIAAMNLSLDNPGVDMTNGLRIGLHVQSINNGGSESFVNSDGNGDGEIDGGDGGSVAPTPAPAGIFLVLSALPVAVGMRRWFNRRTVVA